MVPSVSVGIVRGSTTGEAVLPLPAELAHVVEAFDSSVRREAHRVVRVAMAERLAENSPGAWRGSRLTGDGFPAEVAFSTADHTLRLTLEPGPVDSAPPARIERANEAIVRAGGIAVPDSVRASLSDLQAGATMRYGAWLGCRIANDTAFKLYAEVPAGRTPGGVWPAAPVLTDREIVPRMVAVTPANGAVETYLRVPSLLPGHLAAVLDPVGLADSAGSLLSVIEEAYGHVIRGRIPGPSVGVSYVAGMVPRVTLHLYARALWGSDARIRRGFLRIARTVEWDSRTYETISAPVAGREDWRTYHALFGITLSPDAVPTFTIGLRPVAP